MEIISNDNRADFTIVGRLDTNTSYQLSEYLEGFSDDDWRNIRIDMSECEYVSSAGLRVIVSMQKKVSAQKGSLVFCNVLPEVMDVFEMTGFVHILTLQ